MVFIYGGGFEFGSSINPTYDGTKFAEDGVILVSLNYRLGNFGESA
jgi:para-nitrobenzyl esterase